MQFGANRLQGREASWRLRREMEYNLECNRIYWSTNKITFFNYMGQSPLDVMSLSVGLLLRKNYVSDSKVPTSNSTFRRMRVFKTKVTVHTNNTSCFENDLGVHGRCQFLVN